MQCIHLQQTNETMLVDINFRKLPVQNVFEDDIRELAEIKYQIGCRHKDDITCAAYRQNVTELVTT